LEANLRALGALALWATLASLSLSLRHVPPFLLTGLALIVGSALAWPAVIRNRAQWQVAPRLLMLGVATLFGFHFLLFIALRIAPPVEVNLVNYLWPLFMVVLAPLYLPGVKLRRVHVAAAAVGFAGAAVAILGAPGAALQASAQAASQPPAAASGGPALGYLLALGSGLIWANFSLQTRRLESLGQSFPTAALGLFGLLSGALSLLCHALFEPAVSLTLHDGLLLAAIGFGPLGGAFYLWDRALKLGDARHIGLLSYLAPLASTVLLMALTQRAPSWHIALAAALIIGAAVVGTRKG
jgi:drug/metabolite transporter (DMT)-like permease